MSITDFGNNGEDPGGSEGQLMSSKLKVMASKLFMIHKGKEARPTGLELRKKYMLEIQKLPNIYTP